MTHLAFGDLRFRTFLYGDIGERGDAGQPLFHRRLQGGGVQRLLASLNGFRTFTTLKISRAMKLIGPMHIKR